MGGVSLVSVITKSINWSMLLDSLNPISITLITSANLCGKGGTEDERVCGECLDVLEFGVDVGEGVVDDGFVDLFCSGTVSKAHSQRRSKGLEFPAGTEWPSSVLLLFVG